MKKERKGMRRGVKAFVVILCLLIVIIGCSHCAMIIGRTIALKTDHFGTTSTEVFDPTAEFCDESTFVTLEKDPDKDFVILNITDTHLSDYDYRYFTGAFALRDVKRLVNAVQPDLITLSGDNVCAKSQYHSIKKLTETLNGFRIPWAPVFGNHDAEADNIDRDFLAEVMIGDKDDPNNYCIMKKGPNNLLKVHEDGTSERRVGNYVINVVEKGTGKLAQTLVMMDTGRDCLVDSQIAWYKQSLATVKHIYGDDAQSTVIMHIPCAEYFYAYMEGYDDVKNDWKTPYKKTGAYGNCYEDVCCHKAKFKSMSVLLASEEYKKMAEKGYTSDEYKDYFLKNGVPIDNGFGAALKECGTKNVLCGHDHLNCFFAPYDGINYAYALKNGMGSGFKVGRNGGTVLTVSSDAPLSIDYYYL